MIDALKRAKIRLSILGTAYPSRSKGKTMMYTEGPQKLIARLRSVAETLTDERAQYRLFMAADEFESRFAEMAERTTRKKLLVRWGS